CVWHVGCQIALELIGNSLNTFTAPVRSFGLTERTERMSRYSNRCRFPSSSPNVGHRGDRSKAARSWERTALVALLSERVSRSRPLISACPTPERDDHLARLALKVYSIHLK